MMGFGASTDQARTGSRDFVGLRDASFSRSLRKYYDLTQNDDDNNNKNNNNNNNKTDQKLGLFNRCDISLSSSFLIPQFPS
jgi:hypothetical protein